jgi:hypothetical protein
MRNLPVERTWQFGPSFLVAAILPDEKSLASEPR